MSFAIAQQQTILLQDCATYQQVTAVLCVVRRPGKGKACSAVMMMMMMMMMMMLMMMMMMMMMAVIT